MTKLKMTLALGALMAGVVGPGCNCYPEPQKIVQPPTAVKNVPTKLSGVFLDAASMKPITTTITVHAKNATGGTFSGLRDPSGKAVTSFEVKDGLLSFAVAESVTLPTRIILVASATGYNSSSAKLDLARAGDQSFVVKLVSIANPPEGVSAVERSAGSADGTGVIPMAATVTTPNEPNTGASTTVELPANTKITTKDGKPLTGQITAAVSYYNNLDVPSLASFPGGFEVSVPAAGAAREDGVFISGGFTAIELRDGNGNVAANFSQPVPVTLGIPAATVNPETGEPVEVGEEIPFWSYDELTGLWKDEGIVTVQKDATGKLFATANVTHLSYFNLDWFYGPDATCNLARKVVVTGNPNKLNFTLQLTNASGYYKAYPPYGGNVNEVQLMNAVQNQPMKLTALYNGSRVGTVDVNDLCSGGDINLAVNMPNVQPASLKITVGKHCEQDPEQRTGMPSTITLLNAQGDVLFGNTDSSGETTITGLAAGRTWDVYAYGYNFQGEGISFPWKTVTTTAGENTLVFEQAVACAVVSGSAGGN